MPIKHYFHWIMRSIQNFLIIQHIRKQKNKNIITIKLYLRPLPIQQSLGYNAGPQEQAAADYYQVNRFYILLDAVVTDIKSWIGSHQKSSFLLSKLLDCNLASETWEEFKPTYDNYSVYLENESRVKVEFHFWQKKVLHNSN